MSTSLWTKRKKCNCGNFHFIVDLGNPMMQMFSNELCCDLGNPMMQMFSNELC
jgi:hypothetical protein